MTDGHAATTNQDRMDAAFSYGPLVIPCRGFWIFDPRLTIQPKILLQTDDKETMKRNKPITEDTRFNMKSPPNTEGNRRQPANLHYIECSYKHRGFTMIFLSQTAAHKRYTWSNPNVYQGLRTPHPQAFLGVGTDLARLSSAFAPAFWRDAQALLRFGQSLRQRASAVLCPKSALIHVQLNLDHNSMNTTHTPWSLSNLETTIYKHTFFKKASSPRHFVFTPNVRPSC